MKKYPGIWFLSLFLIPIGVTIFAYDQLSYIGYVPQKEPEETPFIPVQSTITTFSDTSNPIPLWLIMAIPICCAAGSFVIFYLLQSSREAQKLVNAFATVKNCTPRNGINPQVSPPHHLTKKICS